MSFARAGTLATFLSIALLAGAARAEAPTLLPIGPVDLDDDDHDGTADVDDRVANADLRGDLVELGGIGPAGAPLSADASFVRFFGGERPTTSPHAGKTSFAQGRRPGRTPLLVGKRTATLRFVEVRLFDATGARVDPVKSGVELARTPPSRLADDPFERVDESSFRAVLIGDPADLDAPVSLASYAASGARIDTLDRVDVRPVPCPDDVPKELACRSTVPLRLAIDPVDRLHPVARDRSIEGELGGGVVVSLGGRKMLLARVLGPRRTVAGPIDRYRAHLRALLVRDRPHGAPPFGINDAAAIALVRAQIARANAVWGECGVAFGPPEQADVRLVDPPPPHLVAVGCDLALPASGGEIRFRAEGKEVRVTTTRGEPARVVAERLVRAIEAVGLVAVTSDNLRIGPGADASVDVLVRKRDGNIATVEPPVGAPLDTDATLSVCLGGVDFTDGLQHFSDVDAVAGTVEERALLKAYDDGDPRTVEVYFIPSFATGGRIGESFIQGDRSSLANMLIEDRAGIRADNISFALAHELGHVLLDVPGHSDDFGVDTPSRLMDSDAADPSAFGPRRLTTDECARALRESGPTSASGVLVPWPLQKLVRKK